MIYRISILDDEENFALALKNMIERYADERGLKVDVGVHDNPVNYFTGYKSNADILFCDIKMPLMNGMELVEKLTEIDKKLAIIFTTSFIQYSIDGYLVHALGYLLKPIDYEIFKKTMNRAIEYVDGINDKSILVKDGGSVTRLFIKDVKYIEIYGRDLSFYTSDGKTVSAKGTLRTYEKQLEPYGFVRCSHSYFVNMRYVDKVQGYDVIIDDKKIPISRGTKKSFMEALVKYLGEN